MSEQGLCYALLGWIGPYQSKVKSIVHIIHLMLKFLYAQGQAAASQW